jgi:hypothetical protein
VGNKFVGADSGWGTVNILEEGSFAGEGIMEVLHQGERRLLSYAGDTAVHVTTESEPRL